MNQTSRQSLWMLAASFCFACMGVCVKLAASRHSAAEIVFWRSAVSLILVLALMRWQRIDLRTPVLALQLFRGATGFVSLVLYFLAIVCLPLATAVTLNYTSPLFLALLLTVVGGQRPSAALSLALAVGLVGVGILLNPSFRSEQWAGGLAAIGSGFMASVAYFNVRELGGRGEPEARTVFYFALVSTVLAAVWLAFVEIHVPDPRSALLLLGVGVFATLAQLAMTRAYKSGKTFVSASLAYTTVVFASLLGGLVWGDPLGWQAGFGMLLIVSSGIAATAYSRRPAALED